MSQAVDTNYLAGMVWERVPQVRVAWRSATAIDLGGVDRESRAADRRAAGRRCPSAAREDIAAQYNTGHEALSVPNLMPDVVTRVAINPTQGGPRRRRRRVAPVPPHAGAVRRRAACVGRRRERQHAGEPATASTRLIGQAAYGPGSGGRWAALVPDVAFRADGSIRGDPGDVLGGGCRAGRHRRVCRSQATTRGCATDDSHFVDTDGAHDRLRLSGLVERDVNRSITEITGTVSFQAVRTENRGSAQVGVQTSWLRREPWSVGSGPGSAERVPVLRAAALQPPVTAQHVVSATNSSTADAHARPGCSNVAHGGIEVEEHAGRGRADRRARCDARLRAPAG